MCDSDGVFIKQVIGNEVYMFDSILLEFLITVFFFCYNRKCILFGSIEDLIFHEEVNADSMHMRQMWCIIIYVCLRGL